MEREMERETGAPCDNFEESGMPIMPESRYLWSCAILEQQSNRRLQTNFPAHVSSTCGVDGIGFDL